MLHTAVKTRTSNESQSKPGYVKVSSKVKTQPELVAAASLNSSGLIILYRVLIMTQMPDRGRPHVFTHGNRPNSWRGMQGVAPGVHLRLRAEPTFLRAHLHGPNGHTNFQL